MTARTRPLPGPATDRRRVRMAAGFTLTELAVVLVIIALVVGSLLVPLTAQIDARNTADTRKAIAEVREALLGFAVVNGRLPCPALATTASDAAGAGQEGPSTGTGCSNAAGVLPWRDLGVDETDAWGRRYTYSVTSAFGRAIGTSPSCGGVTPANTGFSLCSAGSLAVSSLSTGGGVIANNLPVVVVSHGKNGNGAYTPQGAQLFVGNDPDERANQLATPTSMNTGAFVKKGPTPSYDDEVVWLPPALLFNRMITVGKLP